MKEKKIESFLDTVYSAAEKKSRQMLREIDRAGNTALREYSAELRRSADAARRRENLKTARLSAENAAHDESALRCELLGRRDAMADEVFAEVCRHLEEYRSTPKYGELMRSLARDAAAALEGCTDAALYLMEADAAYADEVASLTGLPVRIGGGIAVGGIKGTSEELECDCTLDSRLAAAREAFARESGLTVV